MRNTNPMNQNLVFCLPAFKRYFKSVSFSSCAHSTTMFWIITESITISSASARKVTSDKKCISPWGQTLDQVKARQQTKLCIPSGCVFILLHKKHEVKTALLARQLPKQSYTQVQLKHLYAPGPLEETLNRFGQSVSIMSLTKGNKCGVLLLSPGN